MSSGKPFEDKDGRKQEDKADESAGTQISSQSLLSQVMLLCVLSVVGVSVVPGQTATINFTMTKPKYYDRGLL